MAKKNSSSKGGKRGSGFGGGPTVSQPAGSINFNTSSPFTAQTAITGKFDAGTVMMGYQINTNNPMQITSPNGVLDFAHGSWSLTLTTFDCPTPQTAYSIVVFEWNGNGSAESTPPVQFMRGT